MKYCIRLALAFFISVSSVLGVQAHAQAPEMVELDVLSPSDVDVYTQIFDLQENGRWQSADALIAEIDNEILMGYVTYQRLMHPTAYRAKFRELKRWMAYYADHPNANKIYKLAVKRRPRGESNPARPTGRKWRTAGPDPVHPALEADYRRTNRARVRQIEGRARYLSSRNRALDALKELDRHVARKTITTRQYDRMRSYVAASLYHQGYIDRAKRISTQSLRSGETAPLSYWVAGLIAFREGDTAKAYANFSEMAKNTYQDDALRSAAGFWAARTALASGEADSIASNLEIAAQYPFTFYGQLALAQLGRQYDYSWDAPIVTSDGLTAIKAQAPGIERAIALAQVGREIDADLELRWANGKISDERDYDLLAVAHALELPAAQIDIALSGNGKYLESGLYPVPDYAPENGFQVDRALLFALIRQESKFKVEATSRVGARGLMQLMPRTASYIAKDRSLRYASGRERLYDPGYNLRLGQTYVDYLMGSAAKGDLFHLAVAYNGGPGNLRRWKRKLTIDDPLLFIESIPSRENRQFIEHVLTNFWIYRDRLGQPAPTRAKVAAGDLPLYEALDQISAQGSGAQ